MKTDIKERWIAALESGEYEQGRGYLKTSAEGVDKFCCLGVLCDLYSKEQDVPWSRWHAERIFSMDEATVALPATVMNWAGWEANDIFDASKLMQLNDHEGEWHVSPLDDANYKIVNEAKYWHEKYGGNSFKEIAQAIRDNL